MGLNPSSGKVSPSQGDISIRPQSSGASTEQNTTAHPSATPPGSGMHEQLGNKNSSAHNGRRSPIPKMASREEAASPMKAGPASPSTGTASTASSALDNDRAARFFEAPRGYTLKLSTDEPFESYVTKVPGDKHNFDQALEISSSHHVPIWDSQTHALVRGQVGVISPRTKDLMALMDRVRTLSDGDPRAQPAS